MKKNQYNIKNAVGIIHKSLIIPRAKKKFASSKKRCELRGGGRKPWKQKGTGNARAGSIRSSIWVGGNKAFGPQPNETKKKINKKENQLAVLHSLFLKKNHIVANIKNDSPNKYLKDDLLNAKKYRLRYQECSFAILEKFTFEPSFIYSNYIFFIVTKEEYQLLSKKIKPKNIKITTVDKLSVHMILKSKFVFTTRYAYLKINEMLYAKKFIHSRKIFTKLSL
jgi:ribosomal protein L4